MEHLILSIRNPYEEEMYSYIYVVVLFIQNVTLVFTVLAKVINVRTWVESIGARTFSNIEDSSFLSDSATFDVSSD